MCKDFISSLFGGGGDTAIPATAPGATSTKSGAVKSGTVSAVSDTTSGFVAPATKTKRKSVPGLSI